MDPERWRRIEGLFHEAVEADLADRDRLIERRCEGDPELLSEVRTLLSARERSAEFLEQPIPTRDPEQIGGYRIVRRIASGGMGVVYEAEQPNPLRRVALKVLRLGLYGDEAHAKLFRREIRTLARLTHPGIAAIYEAGVAEAGLPFFTMELVAGLPLDEFVKTRDLDLEARLALFLQVCDAVQYAHQRGVVHRDLKPANILVDASGEPKVLDFGLARLIETDMTVTLTDLSKAMGTLPYMSPEQVEGPSDEVDVRSDVYALGVLLYVMLTDQLPFDFDGKSLPSCVRSICEEEPRAPRAVRRELKGELDTIISKCLEKDPRQRYPSAAALSDDLRRHLDGLPILAYPPSALYQLRKLAGRNKVAAASLVAALLVLLGSVAALVVKNQELTHERDRAVRAEEVASEEADRALEEEQKALEVVDFLEKMLAWNDPNVTKGRELTVRQVLDVFSARLQSELERRPAVRASLHGTLGRAYSSLGRYVEAERHLTEQLAILGPSKSDPRATADARYYLAAACELQGKYEPAREHLSRSLDAYRALGLADEIVTARALLNLASIHRSLGDRVRARELLEQTLAIAEGGTSDDAAHLTASALQMQARLSGERGNAAEAEALLRQALEYQRERWGDDDTRVANSRAEFSDLLAGIGRLAEAEEQLRLALETRSRLLAEDHPTVIATRQNLATLYIELGRAEEAEPILLDVLADWRAHSDEPHEDLASTLSTLGTIEAGRGEYYAAEPFMREALEVYLASASDDPVGLSKHHLNLAKLLYAMGELDESESHGRTSLELLRSALGDRHPNVAFSLTLLGDLRDELGDPDAAHDLYTRAQAVLSHLFGEGHPETVFGHRRLAEFLLRYERTEEAIPHIRCIEDALTAAGADSSPVAEALAGALAQVGAAKLERGETAAAVGHFEERVAVLERTLGAEHPETAAAASELERIRVGGGGE